MNPDLIDVLREKLGHLGRIREHLEYSRSKIVAWWRVDQSFDLWSPDQLETLAAFKARFAEMQDHLALAMKQIAAIEEQPTEAFSYVLNYMVKLGILLDDNEWRDIRNLRNAAVHDYSASEQDKALHYHGLLQHTDFLLQVHADLKGFAARVYSIH
ncbi:MAG TPA: hypothetical protein PLW81_04005 [Thiobacillaceae bacterium]|nr:hypothetical protein [Thiobacillaceae bacterium]